MLEFYTLPLKIGIIAIEATTACVELQWYIHYTCGGNGVVIFLLPPTQSHSWRQCIPTAACHSWGASSQPLPSGLLIQAGDLHGCLGDGVQLPTSEAVKPL